MDYMGVIVTQGIILFKGMHFKNDVSYILELENLQEISDNLG